MLPRLARRPPGAPTSAEARSRGQSLVEFALLLPVLLLLVLFALDFGRIFLGWVTLNNMARIGADYAAKHPNDFAGARPAEYDALILDSFDAINCDPDETTFDPDFSGDAEPGDHVTVDLSCDFSPLTPLIGSLFDNAPITVSASSAFPVGYGCIGECDPGGGNPPPPPPDNCRSVPDMIGMSVLGARNAWVEAGFGVASFDPDDPADDARTVADQTVTEPTNTEGCTAGEAFVFASVAVDLEPLVVPDPPIPGCVPVPNLVGMTVDQARDAWVDAGMGGAFVPVTGFGLRVVTDQFVEPDAEAGECVVPPLDVQVTYGDALDTPPVQPCQVPSFANRSSTEASGLWTGNGFTGAITFNNANRLPYAIKSQSLVGGAYVLCTSGITLSNTGNTN
ncbi:MAG TPA: TadE/TadG family type IV pilus assembly protein [Candidatus Limnocylindrales bacterium]|nr:TadE/TadG family type IV pilus assembly protein [Candidatus Limnocylindrales bacterium]